MVQYQPRTLHMLMTCWHVGNAAGRSCIQPLDRELQHVEIPFL